MTILFKKPLTRVYRALLICALAASLPTHAQQAAQATLPDEDADTSSLLKVATRESPPFSFRDETGKWRGLAIDLWEQIALAMNIRYTYVEMDTLPELLDSVVSGHADIVASGLTISSERENLMDFSHPYISSHLGILSQPAREGMWITLFRRFFSLPFLLALLSLSVVLLASGALVYFFERKRNPEQFNQRPLYGLGDAFWWSAVTMTTVGYGDKAPVTLPGRLVALVWMFMSVIILSTFTASIVSSLALERETMSIEHPRDLRPGRVGTLAESTSDTYLKRLDLKPRYANSIPTLLHELEAGLIDAIVYDVPILSYYLRGEPKDAVVLAPVSLQRQDYGFAMTQGSDLRQPINVALLNILTDPIWQYIKERYSHLN